MRLLHTADWHLGQTFYEHDRTYEHTQFLKWLVTTLQENEVDVLLMSGDVFDVSNPSAASVTLFYTFLKDAVHANPHLQIIITAGNHDSPSRLEAPKPLLEVFNISIIGTVQQGIDKAIDYQQMVIPIKNRSGAIVAWCMAVPFLRNGDYPTIPDTKAPYTDGIMAFYDQIYTYTQSLRTDGQAIIAMGHLHSAGSSVSEDDKSERQIMGGVELIPATTFNNGIAYTALGHIHCPQKIGGKENIRYSGSPIPMSFSEVNYNHQVVIVDIEGEEVTQIKPILIPVTVSLLRIPATHKPINEVLEALLERLPIATTDDKTLAPYLEVRVLLDSPQPALRHDIENAIQNKYVRLARIDPKYPVAEKGQKEILSIDQLNELVPADVFKKVYQAKYNAEPADELVQFFNEVVGEIN